MVTPDESNVVGVSERNVTQGICSLPVLPSSNKYLATFLPRVMKAWATTRTQAWSLGLTSKAKITHCSNRHLLQAQVKAGSLSVIFCSPDCVVLLLQKS